MAERALAQVDLGAIERNCTRLPKPLCAVVKADAYGHGDVAAAALAGGATWLAVAAACLGTLAHALAGRVAAERVGTDHVMAGDVIDALPHGLTLR